jgi:hypothetical protein
MTPPELSAQTIEEGRRTLETVSRPNVFIALVALVAIAGNVALIYFDRQDRAREAAAQVKVMEGMLLELQSMNKRLTRLELRLPGGGRLAVPVVHPEEEEPQ